MNKPSNRDEVLESAYVYCMIYRTEMRYSKYNGVLDIAKKRLHELGYTDLDLEFLSDYARNVSLSINSMIFDNANGLGLKD